MDTLMVQDQAPLQSAVDASLRPGGGGGDFFRAADPDDEGVMRSYRPKTRTGEKPVFAPMGRHPIRQLR